MSNLDEINASNLDDILYMDGNIYTNCRGNTYSMLDAQSYWATEVEVGETVDILGYGVVEVVEVAVGKVMENYTGDYSYDNYIVLKVGDRFFKKTGYYSSWDGGALDGPWTEVEMTEKTIYVWEPNK